MAPVTRARAPHENHHNQTSSVSISRWLSHDPLIEARWHENYELLVEFKNRYGHCRVTKSIDKRLVVWIYMQRMHRKKGVLHEDRIRKLNAIGFEWDLLKSVWQDKYLLLLEFQKQNGHCRVTKGFDKSLSIWVQRIRHKYKKGRVTEDRKQKLNDIGFEWEVKTIGWQEHYEHLLEFKNKHGHCLVTIGLDKGLAIWVHRQRTNYRKGRLTEDQKQQLNDIGFEWKVKTIGWQEHYEHLLEFQKQNGHCRVTKGFDKSLLIWVYRQRTYYRKGRLTENQKQKLNDIGFEWDYRKGRLTEDQKQQLNDIGFEWKVRRISWQDQYAHLLEFQKQNGHCRVTKGFDERLLVWVYRQRTYYRKGRLTENQKQKLNDIGFEWEVKVNKVAASDNDSQRSDDNYLPQQQQTAAAMTATGALKPRFTPMPQDVTSQPFVEMDAGNGDSNICEEFKESVTYGDSEYWI